MADREGGDMRMRDMGEVVDRGCCCHVRRRDVATQLVFVVGGENVVQQTW